MAVLGVTLVGAVVLHEQVVVAGVALETMAITRRTLGRTGAEVTILGYGAMELSGRTRAASEDKNWRTGPLSQDPGLGQRNWETSGIADLLSEAGMSNMEFVLRFTLSHPGLSTTIVGTANPVHLASNIAVAERGPLPADLYEEAKKYLPLPETRLPAAEGDHPFGVRGVVREAEGPGFLRRYQEVGAEANRLSPSASERYLVMSCPRTLLPAASSGGENVPRPPLPGDTVTMPPATPLLPGRPTS